MPSHVQLIALGVLNGDIGAAGSDRTGIDDRYIELLVQLHQKIGLTGQRSYPDNIVFLFLL